MDEQDAIKLFDSFGKTFTLDESREDIHCLIKSIYKRIDIAECKNCKYYENESIFDNEYQECKLFYIETRGISNVENFGCNKFKDTNDD